MKTLNLTDEQFNTLTHILKQVIGTKNEYWFSKFSDEANCVFCVVSHYESHDKDCPIVESEKILPIIEVENK